MKRPRPGTALDRVYGFHIQAGTLDELIADLTKQASEDDGSAGNRWMLVGLLQLQRGNDAAAAESLAAANRPTILDRQGAHCLAATRSEIPR